MKPVENKFFKFKKTSPLYLNFNNCNIKTIDKRILIIQDILTNKKSISISPIQNKSINQNKISIKYIGEVDHKFGIETKNIKLFPDNENLGPQFSLVNLNILEEEANTRINSLLEKPILVFPKLNTELNTKLNSTRNKNHKNFYEFQNLNFQNKYIKSQLLNIDNNTNLNSPKSHSKELPISLRNLNIKKIKKQYVKWLAQIE